MEALTTKWRQSAGRLTAFAISKTRSECIVWMTSSGLAQAPRLFWRRAVVEPRRGLPRLCSNSVQQPSRSTNGWLARRDRSALRQLVADLQAGTLRSTITTKKMRPRSHPPNQQTRHPSIIVPRLGASLSRRNLVSTRTEAMRVRCGAAELRVALISNSFWASSADRDAAAVEPLSMAAVPSPDMRFPGRFAGCRLRR
jgi:hypothetical protein